MQGHKPAVEGGDIALPQLAALLVCFKGRKEAAKARRPLETRLRSSGNVVLDTTVLMVDPKHAASVYNPHRVVAGALTSLLTWGLFGLLSGGVRSLIFSAVGGAFWGGSIAYYRIHHVTKAGLARIGRQLPARSSVLLIFAETDDPRRLLEATARYGPSAVSVAAIAEDLTARVFTAHQDDPGEIPKRSSGPPPSSDGVARLSMILLRYPDDAAAQQVAGRVAARAGAANALQLELVVVTDRSGRRHVSDPKFGVAATARYNVVSWGGLGLICGALASVTGGSGVVGLLKGGVLTGVAWGLFGLGAGALYGLWAGRATSAGRLKGIGPVLAPGTSTLLAWTDGPLSQDTVDTLTAGPETKRLILSFTPSVRGAILEAA